MQSEQTGRESLSYRIARVVYAETEAKSLKLIEAMTSMIANRAKKLNLALENIISDKTIFTCLEETSGRHELLGIDEKDEKFQVCLRTAQRMLHDVLEDKCYRAIIFHHDSVSPDWAFGRGYIADIDGFLFYR